MPGKFPRLFLILLFLLPKISWATRSCIIDGGGAVGNYSTSDNARLCGSEITFPLIRGIYPSSTTSERLLTGDGNDPAPDCLLGRFFQRSGGQDRQITSKSDAELLDRLRRVRFSVPPQAPLNSQSRVLPATESNVNSCFNEIESGEVCHLWSMNHGQNRGAGAGSLIKLQDSDHERADFYAHELRQLITSSRCGTTRFVLNNCNSGGMLSAILDSNGRVIPNVCGSASTTEFERSLGEGTDPANGRPITMAGVENIVPSLPTYHHIHGVTSYLNQSRRDNSLQQTLDSAHFSSILQNPVAELPLLSTDFFLNRIIGADEDIYIADPLERANSLHRTYQEFQRQCYTEFEDNLVVVNELTDQIQTTLRHFNSTGVLVRAPEITETERARMTSELQNAKWKIEVFETAALCPAFPNQECMRLTNDSAKRQFVRSKFEEWRQERFGLISEVTTCQTRCRETEITENSRQNCISFECRKFVANLDRHTRANLWYRRYEHLQIQLARERKLYEDGTAEQIRDFLTLKNCERGNFYERAPSNSAGPL